MNYQMVEETKLPIGDLVSFEVSCSPTGFRNVTCLIRVLDTMDTDMHQIEQRYGRGRSFEVHPHANAPCVVYVETLEVARRFDLRGYLLTIRGLVEPITASPAHPKVEVAPVPTYRSAKVYSADDIAELLTALPPLAPADKEAFIQKCRQVAKRVEPAPAPTTKRRILLS